VRFFELLSELRDSDECSCYRTSKSFFYNWCEEHFIVTTSLIVKKKIVLLKKNFALETAHLFISLWSLSGKNLLCRTKLDLCTAVDNFRVRRGVFSEEEKILIMPVGLNRFKC
jgi:hypothetical protein